MSLLGGAVEDVGDGGAFHVLVRFVEQRHRQVNIRRRILTIRTDLAEDESVEESVGCQKKKGEM